jgi:hypothetical protein
MVLANDPTGNGLLAHTLTTTGEADSTVAGGGWLAVQSPMLDNFEFGEVAGRTWQYYSPTTLLPDGRVAIYGTNQDGLVIAMLDMSEETPVNGVYVGPTVPTPVDDVIPQVPVLPITPRFPQEGDIIVTPADPVSPPTSGVEMSRDALTILVPPSPPSPPLQAVSSPGDFDGDGVVDTVTTNGPQISVVSGRDGSFIIAPFSPFEAAYTGTLNYVVAYNKNDFQSELVVAPSNGGGGIVAVYDSTGKQLARFFGIDDANFRGGNSLLLADINADGIQDLVVTAGQGGGPRVAIFDGRTIAANATRLQPDFFAFESTQTGGVNAGALIGRIFFSAGVGGGPRVRGTYFSGLKNATATGFLVNAPSEGGIDNFVTDPSNRNGVKFVLETTRDPGTQYDYLRLLADIGDGNRIEIINSNPPVSPQPIDITTSAGMSAALPNLTTLTPFGSQGLKTRDVVVGQGAEVSGNQDVRVFYTGWLTNGTQFDSNRTTTATTFNLSGVIDGFRLGMQGMKPGGIRQILMPAALGYGVTGSGSSIPPNADLVFEVKLLEVADAATISGTPVRIVE